MGEISNKKLSMIENASTDKLKKMFDEAWKKNDNALIGLLAEKIYETKKTSARQAIMYGHLLMSKGKFDEAKEVLNQCNSSNSIFKISALFQIAFEQKNWALCEKTLMPLKLVINKPCSLVAYEIYILKQLKLTIPALVVPKPNSKNQSYLSNQIDHYNMNNTREFMEEKTKSNDKRFDFKGAEVSSLLHDLTEGISEVERGNQVDAFTKPLMFFDKYQFDTDQGLIDVSTIPFTNNIYGFKATDKPDEDIPVYTLKKRT